jgi:hypothetical protein
MEWLTGHVAPGYVLDVGGRNVNGTPRQLFDQDYTVLDVRDAPDVDIVADVVTWQPDREYPVVICAEVLEHAERWEGIVRGCARALGHNGQLIITCAGPGRATHSAVDGGPLRSGEWYANVEPDRLRAVLESCGLSGIVVDQSGLDVRAIATRP